MHRSLSEQVGEGTLRRAELPRPCGIVDAVGLFCPVPIIRTAERVRRSSAGEILEVRADDPVTRIDLPNWCAGAGHRFLGWIREHDELRLFLEVGEDRDPRRKEEAHGS